MPIPDDFTDAAHPGPMRPARKALLVLLGGITVVMLVGLMAVVALLMATQQDERRNERASAIWATYQFGKEVKKLRATLEGWMIDPAPDGARNLKLRVDILYSSTEVLRQVDSPGSAADEPRLRAKAFAAAEQLVSSVDALGGRLDREAALRLRADVMVLDGLAEDLLLKVYVTDSQTRDDEAQFTRLMHRAMAASIVVMTISLIALLSILSRQLLRSRRQLAQLAASRQELTAKSDIIKAQEEREALLRREADLKADVERLNAQLSGYLARLSGMIADVSGVCEAMSGAARSAGEGSRSIAASTARTAEQVDGVAAAAEHVSASGAHIVQRMSQNAHRSQIIEARTARTDEAVHDLQTAMQQIDSVAQLIEEVASQTNLLALNATIEAARAGEAGRGFAVVASEIKNLAAQTKDATSEIARQIAATKIASTTCIETLADIRDAMVQMTGNTDAVTAIVEEQSASVTKVARMIRLAAQEASTASELGETVVAAAEAAIVSANEVSALVRDMNDEARGIGRSIRG